MEKLTRFELTRVLGARALQLSLGAPPLVSAEGLSDPYLLAKAELKDKKLPLAVVRELPDGTTLVVNPY